MNSKNTIFSILFLSTFVTLSAQDFMLQAWYWDYPKTCNGYNWANTLASKVGLISGNFNYVWLPPLSNASSGACSNGYDPRDLYDLGEYAGATGFGTRTDFDALIAAFNSNSINAVADVVYNHRDGGKPEANSAVKDYITTYYQAYKNPFPSDRFRCIIPLGGSSGNGAGDYYFKISSKTGDAKFYNKAYKVYMETNKVGWKNLPDTSEVEPNGGGDCGEGNNSIILGRNWNANIDASGCTVDEFHLNLQASDFNAAGDTLYIYLNNTGGSYSDHRIYGIWSASAGADIVSQLVYQTWTDFTAMPSGQGSANFENFRPNSTNAATTLLAGDWDWLWFFYDVDQDITSTQTLYTDWSRWLWTNAGIRGYRMDAVKHFPPAFVGTLLNNLATGSPSINPGVVVGEFFDTNPVTLKNWVNDVESNKGASTANVRAFDFSLRQALKDACDTYGYDVRNVFGSGMVDAAGASGFNVITFVNNHDYRNSGEPVQNDPILAYAYILTNNQVGLPCVFYPEYFGVPVPNYPNVNLRGQINELIQTHKNYIYQSSSRSYLSQAGSGYSATYHSGGATTTLLYQLKGGIANKDVIVCINFAGDPLDVDHTVDGSNFPVGTTFNLVAGNSTTPTVTVGSGYWANFKVPARSYAVWVQGAVLPVELTDFSVTLQAPDSALLQWKTESETEFRGFAVERSDDGVNFTERGWVDAAGSASAGAAYSFTEGSLKAASTYYYRLRMSDLDGSVEYSPLRSLHTPAIQPNIRVWPNPFENQIHILSDTALESNLILTLSDVMGRQVLYMPVSNVGQLSDGLALEHLPGGVYFLALSRRGEILLRSKLIKEGTN
ncbi:MAG: T9SS C-terminal target domain-containing protein [Bacteroidetes bacterium]|nr:MAG: T9SS C-terminal target domain-containing protein [Bacteroidota bacterium]